MQIIKYLSIFTLLLIPILSMAIEENTQKLKVVDFSEEKEIEIPKYLKELSLLTDKTSYEYETAAYKAAVDTVNSGKEALTSFDSARALKLLTFASRLIPWRGDVVSLRNTALETYIKITNSYIETKDCVEIPKRVEYLKQVAPDGALQLKKIPVECKFEIYEVKKAKDSTVKMLNLNDSVQFLKMSEPKINAALEKSNYTNLPSELSYLVERNTNFPLKDFETMQTKYLFEIWQNFNFSCRNFKIDANVVSDKMFNVDSDCVIGEDAPFEIPSPERLHSEFDKYANIASDLLTIKNGSEEIVVYSKELKAYRKIKTTKPIKDSYPKWFMNSRDLFIFDVILKNSNGIKVIRQTALMLSFHYKDFYKYGQLNIDVGGYARNFDLEYKRDLDYEIDGLITRTFLPPKGVYITLKFNSPKLIDGLEKVSYRLNLRKTFEFYDYYRTHLFDSENSNNEFQNRIREGQKWLAQSKTTDKGTIKSMPSESKATNIPLELEATNNAIGGGNNLSESGINNNEAVGEKAKAEFKYNEYSNLTSAIRLKGVMTFHFIYNRQGHVVKMLSQNQLTKEQNVITFQRNADGVIVEILIGKSAAVETQIKKAFQEVSDYFDSNKEIYEKHIKQLVGEVLKFYK